MGGSGRWGGGGRLRGYTSAEKGASAVFDGRKVAGKKLEKGRA